MILVNGLPVLRGFVDSSGGRSQVALVADSPRSLISDSPSARPAINSSHLWFLLQFVPRVCLLAKKWPRAQRSVTFPVLFCFFLPENFEEGEEGIPQAGVLDF